MIICVANSKDQTKKLKHKGSTGKRKTVRLSQKQSRKMKGKETGGEKKKSCIIPLPHVQNTVKEEKDIL